MSSIDTLLKILRENQETEIGTSWEFRKIRSLEDYQKYVPITTYDTYAPAVEMMRENGIGKILTDEAVFGYSLTSGTTGVPKLIPCTVNHLEPYLEAFEDTRIKGSTLLLCESMPYDPSLDSGDQIDSISGMVLTALRENFRQNTFKKIFSGGAYTSPMELLVTREVMDSVHLRLLFALADPKVGQIIAPFTWNVLEMFIYLENNWELLLEDLELGMIAEGITVSEEMRTVLNDKLGSHPRRAAELRAIFEKGFDTPILPRIWPDCERIIAAGTGSFSVYTEKLPYYTGDVSLYNGYYASSEALIGMCENENMDQYILLDELNFFEFVPVEEEEAVPVPLEKLEPGKCYEILLTSHSGLYRYAMGDVIRFVGMADGRAVFTFEYRYDQCYAMTTEVMTEQQIFRAVQKLEKVNHIEINDFCYWPDELEGTYTIILEPSQHETTMDWLQGIFGEDLESEFETYLQEANPSYRAARAEGKLLACRVLIGQHQTHLLYRDMQKLRRRMAPDQIKPIRLLDNPVKEKFFFSMLDEEFHGSELIDSYLKRYKKKKRKEV